MKMEIEKIHPDVPVPKMAYDDDAAFDLYAAEDVEFAPGQRRQVPTGLKIAIPRGYVGLIRDRSSVAWKQGLTTLAGVIDSGYRGEWLVVLLNTSRETVRIAKHTRIAQFLVLPVAQPEIQVVEKVGESSRGEGGFGSSGQH